MFNKILKFIKSNALIISLAFLPPIIIWIFFQRENRAIIITIEKNVSVVSVDKKYSQGITVKYLANEINSLYVCDITIQNSGNRPIIKTDFDTPITIEFSGKTASMPHTILAEPPSLKPIFQSKTPNFIELKPLLLNPDDKFTFRNIVIDSPDNNPVKNVFGRIKGVKNISIDNKIEGHKNLKEIKFWFIFVISILAVIISSISAAFIFKRFISSVTLKFPYKTTVELSNKLESNPGIAAHTKALAEKLKIDNYDIKSNLLLLRLKIENQLLDLSRKNNLRVDQRQSIPKIAIELSKRGLIPHDVVSSMLDILPSLNRELHSSESYLNNEEFEALQRLSLNIIAAIDSEYFIYGSPCQMSGQKCPVCKKGIMDVDEIESGVKCNKCDFYMPAVEPKI